jgi:hypothetical protein
MAPPPSKAVAVLTVCAVAGVTFVYLSSKKEKNKPEIDQDPSAVTNVNEATLVEPPKLDRNLIIPEPVVTEEAASIDSSDEIKGKSLPEASQEATSVMSAAAQAAEEVKQSQVNHKKKTSPSKKNRRPKKKNQLAVDANLAKKNGAPLTETVQEEKKEQAPDVQQPKELTPANKNVTDTCSTDDSNKNTGKSPSRRHKPRKRKPSTPKQNGTTTPDTFDNNGADPNVTASILKQKTHKKKKPAANGAAAAAAKEIKAFNESSNKKKKTKAKH